MRDPVLWVSLADLSWGRCEHDEIIVVRERDLLEGERASLVEATPEARALILWRAHRRTVGS